jgi:indolepyruvate ferredoxin oxidoreductase, alpha subunit
MERSFKKEVQALKLGSGETFRGEGILAVTKALLQSGVSYVGGYQGAPVSHLLDVLVDAEDIMSELGVHLETCANEASAAAMLGASINYPLRGAVTWKSIVGTNVAADALSNLSSPGVIGGALIILGEDYGEGASVIQERSYAYALKSSMWLLDPRPDLPSIVRAVEKGFELSEASHAPVMLELRIRACHATGEFEAKDNRKGIVSGIDKLPGPPRFEYGRLAHPPVIFRQEKLKVEERLPAARAFIREHKLNEIIPGDVGDAGIIVMGGLTNSVLRALARMGLADIFGASRIPLLVLNVVYPLVPEEIREFCATKRAVLIVEEGFPDYIEQAVNVELRRADIQTKVFGKGPLPQAGEYASDVLLEGLAAFLQAARPGGLDADTIAEKARSLFAHKAKAAAALGPLPPRPPAFCTGCPERPVFSAIKLMQRELGATHISADIGCHSFATFAPFSLGNSILGYGMSLASAAAVTPNMQKRPIAIMGDGGFWHNGLITGVASNLFNQGDGVLIVMQNGYASATGQQYIPSSVTNRAGTAPGMDIENTLRSMGVKWLRTVRTYGVANMVKTLKEAMRTAERGLKVIIADGECQLARQRRVRAEDAGKLKRGERVTRTRYGVDEEICTGDHSCIRLSGCPSLTVKPSPDPLRTDPVATVIDSCVGCGLCGEVAHAAVLCPSFYRAEIVRNATWRDRALFRLRQTVIGWLGGYAGEAVS